MVSGTQSLPSCSACEGVPLSMLLRMANHHVTLQPVGREEEEEERNFLPLEEQVEVMQITSTQSR